MKTPAFHGCPPEQSPCLDHCRCRLQVPPVTLVTGGDEASIGRPSIDNEAAGEIGDRAGHRARFVGRKELGELGHLDDRGRTLAVRQAFDEALEPLRGTSDSRSPERHSRCSFRISSNDRLPPIADVKCSGQYFPISRGIRCAIRNKEVRLDDRTPRGAATAFSCLAQANTVRSIDCAHSRTPRVRCASNAVFGRTDAWARRFRRRSRGRGNSRRSLRGSRTWVEHRIKLIPTRRSRSHGLASSPPRSITPAIPRMTRAG